MDKCNDLQLKALVTTMGDYCDINSKIELKTWGTIVYKTQSKIDLLPVERSLLMIVNSIDEKLNNLFKEYYGFTVHDETILSELPMFISDRISNYQKVLSEKTKITFMDTN